MLDDADGLGKKRSHREQDQKNPGQLWQVTQNGVQCSRPRLSRTRQNTYSPA